MKTLLIVVVLVAATCADVAYFGNNYVIPAEINNELQDTYILPATKEQSTYVALPVSIVNTYIPPKSIEVSQKDVVSPTLQIRSSGVHLPDSISSVLEKGTQKTIQNTVQTIIKKTVTPNVPTNSDQLSSNTYLPPITKIKTSHAHLPELIDTPPRAIQEIVKASIPPAASVQVKLNSAGVRLPELINTTTPSKTIKQTAVNIAPKPVQVPQTTDISSSSQTKVNAMQNIDISSTLKTKPTAVYVPVIINNSSPSKTVQTVQKPVKTLSESIKVIQKTDISATSKSEVPAVHLPEIVNTSKPSVTVEKTVSFVPEPVKTSQVTGISTILKAKSSEENKVNNSIPREPLLISIRNDISSTLEAKTSEVKTVNTSTPPAPVQVSKNTISTLKTKSPEVINTSTPSKTIEKTVNISIPPAPAQVQKNTYSTSTLQTKSPEVNIPKLVNTSSPPKTIQTTVISSITPAPVQVLQGADISSSSQTKVTAPLNTKLSDMKTVNTANSPAPGQVSLSTNAATSTLKIKPSEVKIVSTSIPTAPVQATQSSDSSSTIKTKLAKVPLPALVAIIIPPEIIKKTVKTSTPPAPVKVSQRIDISLTSQTKSEAKLPEVVKTETSPKATEKTVQKTLNSSPKPDQAIQTTSPPATVKSPPSLWHLPKVIDIVQKTIKSSVNSNIKPQQVEKLDITKILPGSVNGPENHYLPPDQNKNYENVEVFTSEGYVTERRLKATS